MKFCVFFNFIFDLPHVITKQNNSSIVNDYTTSDKTKKNTTLFGITTKNYVFYD